MITSWRDMDEVPQLGFLPIIAALTPEIIAELGIAAATITPFVVKYSKPLIVKSLEYVTPLALKTKSLWMSMPAIAQMGAVAAASAATWAAVKWAATDTDYKEAGKGFSQVLAKYWEGDNLAKYIAESAPFTRAWMVQAATNGVPQNPTSDTAWMQQLSKDSGLSYYDTQILTYAITEAHAMGYIGEAVWNGTSQTATADLQAKKKQNEALAPSMSWQTTALWGVGIFAAAYVLKGSK